MSRLTELLGQGNRKVDCIAEIPKFNGRNREVHPYDVGVGRAG